MTETPAGHLRWQSASAAEPEPTLASAQRATRTSHWTSSTPPTSRPSPPPPRHEKLASRHCRSWPTRWLRAGPSAGRPCGTGRERHYGCPRPRCPTSRSSRHGAARAAATSTPHSHRSLRQHPPAGPLPRPPQRSGGRCDATGSAASSTNTCRPHEVTWLSAPTRWGSSTSSAHCSQTVARPGLRSSRGVRSSYPLA
jgi:hypothetical protein